LTKKNDKSSHQDKLTINDDCRSKKKRLICRDFHREFASCISASSHYFRACHENRNTYFELDMPKLPPQIRLTFC